MGHDECLPLNSSAHPTAMIELHYYPGNAICSSHPPARARPQLGAYLQRLLARPALQRVMADEGLVAPWV